MSNLVTKLTIAALLAGASSAAMAAPGDGIRLGGSEGRLHPFLELEGRWDSRVYVDPNVTPPKEVADFIVHVRPGLTLAVPGDLTSVDLMAKLDVTRYLRTSADVPTGLDKVYAEAELGVAVNKRGMVGLELSDDFRRSDRPQALSIGSGVVSNFNVLEVRVPFRPGGGALTVTATGGWALETYEAQVTGSNCPNPLEPLCNLGDLGYDELKVGAGAAWKFLPRTSALLEGHYFKRLPKLSSAADPGGYRINAGVTGLVTAHIAATLKAGYGSTTSVTTAAGTTPALGTWLAAAEVEWIPSETTSVKVGYGHDLTVDPRVQYTTNKLTLDARQLVAGRFAFGLTAGMDRLGYTPGSESTTILQVSPSVGVEITRWLRTELAYAYTDRASTSGAPLFGVDYSKSEVWLKVVATY